MGPYRPDGLDQPCFRKVAGKRTYTKLFLTDFISLYKALPCLWRVKSKEYLNREKKIAAYKKMIALLKEVEPEANREMVVKRVNSLRSSYRKERNKAAEEGDAYEPTLWYYHQLTFLDDDNEESQPTTSKQKNCDTTITVKDSPEHPSSRCSSSNSMSSEQDMLPTTSDSTSSSLPPTTLTLHLTNGTDGPTEDKHAVFGRNVANKLRSLPNKQRIYLEKIINDAIFVAELGNLDSNCYISIPPPECDTKNSDTTIS